MLNNRRLDEEGDPCSPSSTSPADPNKGDGASMELGFLEPRLLLRLPLEPREDMLDRRRCFGLFVKVAVVLTVGVDPEASSLTAYGLTRITGRDPPIRRRRLILLWLLLPQLPWLANDEQDSCRENDDESGEKRAELDDLEMIDDRLLWQFLDGNRFG